MFHHELLFPPVPSIQAGGRWHRDAGALCSRGQILHRVPSPTERRSDHPGELPQPDHPGNHPPSGTDRGGSPAVDASFTCLLTLFLSQNGNITELLLKEGFARCVDWSMAVYTQGAEKLRAAERWESTTFYWSDAFQHLPLCTFPFKWVFQLTGKSGILPPSLFDLIVMQWWDSVLCQICKRAQGPYLEGLCGSYSQPGPEGQAICCQGEFAKWTVSSREKAHCCLLVWIIWPLFQASAPHNTLRLTLTTVTHVPKNSTHTFNGKRNQSDFMKDVWMNALQQIGSTPQSN